MSIRDNFCPKCGKPSDQEGLCMQCRIGSTPWFTCDARARNVQCPSCGAIKQVNTWTDSTRTRQELAPGLATSAVHFHPDVKKPEIDVVVEELTVNRSRATLAIRGTLYKTPVTGTCTVEIIWDKEQCDRCNRISGSYYEGIVQVRAEGRIPSTFEVQMSASIAQQIEETLQSGGERLSFISDMNEIHDGIDIIIGTQHIGLLISQGIVAQLGGRYTTHPKLVGEKNGRQLYRITYSVRLPRFQKHDVVMVRKRYYEVERVESNHVRGLDLKDGTSKSLRADDVERIIGNSRNVESALAAFSDNTIVGILDPVSGRTHEIARPGWMEIRAGDHVNILRDGEQFIIVR
ncbi:MAG: 60S ribosomal export protein NMD3 [Methanoregula sp.]|uniref:60S ribosomal export protein NMD3 n=1 Tax=Methanoregula sp. TaxID=2052170 RepID=UPI002600AE0C|nr:60S ribosomal export protein NMD3 [Methanoregula sp.]MCK9630341.1 60S ribosomal export protein NMD3 [Methanoregula sp.]